MLRQELVALFQYFDVIGAPMYSQALVKQRPYAGRRFETLDLPLADQGDGIIRQFGAMDLLPEEA